MPVAVSHHGFTCVQIYINLYSIVYSTQQAHMLAPLNEPLLDD
jgi:hypothetical protein